MKVRELIQDAAETFARNRVELERILRTSHDVAERIKLRWAIAEAEMGPRLSAEEKRFLVHCLWRWTVIRHCLGKTARRRSRRAARKLERRLRLARMAS